MPTYRANVTDRAQTVLETAESEDGVLVFEDQKTRVVARGAQTGSERTQNAGHALGRNAGVVLPHDDRPNAFPGDTIGKA
jgi:hypothetical protein